MKSANDDVGIPRDLHVDAVVAGSNTNVVHPSHVSDMVDVCCNQKHVHLKAGKCWLLLCMYTS